MKISEIYKNSKFVQNIKSNAIARVVGEVNGKYEVTFCLSTGGNKYWNIENCKEVKLYEK